MPKDNPKLTLIEEKLLEAARNGTPVLLHGKDAIDREKLVLKIHMLNGGTDSALEYFDDKGNLVPKEEYTKSVWIAFTNKHKLKLPHSRSTQRTWDYINCAGMTAREVYHELVESTRLEREFDNYEKTALESTLQSIGVTGTTTGDRYIPGALFNCNGMLFIDNVYVYDRGDNACYDKIAGILKNTGVDYKLTTFEWLIVYVNNPGDFPQYFREQFTEISLEPEKQGQSNGQDLNFTYNKQSHTLTFHGKDMKLSKKRAKLFKSLKQPKNIRWILRKFYSKEIDRHGKVTDSKSVPYHSFASKFNKDWRNHFNLNKEFELIKCENEIVSIVQKIDWK